MGLFVALDNIRVLHVGNVFDLRSLFRLIAVELHPPGILIAKSLLRQFDQFIGVPSLVVDTWSIDKYLPT